MTATGAQIETLLEFLSEHPDLARGLIHSVKGRARAKRLWDNLAAQLNSLGGAVKTVQQWKKVWADRKYLAKKANAAARRSATSTDGRPPTADLISQNDLRVVSIMGEGFGEPDIPAGRVPAFPELLELQPTLEPPGHEVQSDRVEGPPTPPQTLTLPGPSNPENIAVLRRPRRRWLRPVTQPNIRTEILKLENEKREVFVGILNELKTMNSYLKKIAEKYIYLFVFYFQKLPLAFLSSSKRIETI